MFYTIRLYKLSAQPVRLCSLKIGATHRRLNKSKRGYMYRYLALLLFLVSTTTFADVNDVDTSDLRVAFDISGTHSGLTTYKGYSDDFSAYAKFKYKNLFIQPFVRATSSSYYFLDESIPGNSSYSRNEKKMLWD